MPSQSLSVLALALALSGVGLLGGPLILSLGRGRALTAALVEGLTLGLVPTMVALRLLPHVAEQLGAWAIVLLLLAFIALRGFDRAHHRAAARVGRAFIYTALMFHSFTDGVGLAAAIAASPSSRAIDLTLTLAFVVHRLPEGLFIATTLLPSYGMRRTLLRIGGLVGATVAGGLLGGALLPHLPERLFDAVVALGLGAMLQLVVHSHAERATRASTRAVSALALLAGVTAAVLVPAPHDLLREASPSELSMVESLGPLFVTTAPWMLGGLLVGAIASLLPAPPPPTGADRGVGAVLRGLRFGARLPLAPSAALPAARGLSQHGASPGAIVAFLVSASGTGIDGLLLSLPLLGVGWSLWRGLGAVGVALIAGLAAGGTRGAVARAGSHAHAAARPSLLAALLRAIDQRSAYYLAGLLAAAALEAALPATTLAHTGVLTMALVLVLCMPLHLALVATLPVCAVLVHKGLPPAAALAFALFAPALHAQDLRFVARLDGSAAVRSALATLATAIAIAVAAPPMASTPEMHALLTRAPGAIEWAAAAVLACGIAVSLVRLGPRLWIGQLTLFGEADSGSEEHDHDHEHDHGRAVQNAPPGPLPPSSDGGV